MSSSAPVGDSNNYQSYIAQNNCAIYRVSTTDNSFSCVLRGVEAVSFVGKDFGKQDGASQKTIQFDDNGNLYILGNSFTVNNDKTAITKITTGRLYKVLVSDLTNKAITQDNEDVTFFTTLKSGEVVAQLTRGNGNDFVMIQNNANASRLTLDSGTNNHFVNTDTYRALIYGNFGGTDKAIRMVRSATSGGIERVSLDYSSNISLTSGGKTYSALVPQRVLVADDGFIYTTYAATANDNTSALLIYRTLPFVKDPVAIIPMSGDWWTWMKNRPLQVKRGILYYADQIDVPSFGKADVITMVRLNNGAKTQLFTDQRYRIDSWKARGDTLFFSGIDQAANVVIQGQINTLKAAQQMSTGTVTNLSYTINTSSSASASSATVEDIEVLAPQQPQADTGMNPSILTAQSTSKSALLSFTKYMDKADVESKVTVTKNNSSIAYFPLWVYQNLHMVYDTNNGLTNDATSGLPTGGGTHTLAIAPSDDAYE